MLTPREEARAYRIWAVGKSVKWDCTLREIADETGLDVPIVRRICTAKGWKANEMTCPGNLFSTRSGVDLLMASPKHRQYEGKT
jgi:hypothetical protein